MDPEKAMEFILQNLARVSAKTGEHEERMDRFEQEIKASQAQIANELAAAVDLIGRLAQAEIVLNQRMTTLAEAQAHTDQRLDALIDVVDQVIRRNGHPPAGGGVN